MKEIPLTRGKVALVDDEDFATLSAFQWLLGANGYAVRNLPRGKGQAYMHREILGVTDRKLHVDHRNHDPLDNQRANLRTCPASRNIANSQKWRRKTTSRFKGVSWLASSGKWRAAIGVAMKSVHLGLFTDEKAAAEAYNAAATLHFGEFANLNPI